MIHAAMEPVQVVTVVSAVQIKSFFGMDFERFRCWEGRAWPTFKIARDGRMDYDWLTVVKPWMRQTWKDFQKKNAHPSRSMYITSSLPSKIIWHPTCHNGTSQMPSLWHSPSYDTSKNQIRLANPSYALLRMASKSSPLRFMQMKFIPNDNNSPSYIPNHSGHFAGNSPTTIPFWGMRGRGGMKSQQFFEIQPNSHPP